MDESEFPNFYTLADIARMTGVPRETICRQMARGQVTPYVKAGYNRGGVSPKKLPHLFTIEAVDQVERAFNRNRHEALKRKRVCWFGPGNVSMPVSEIKPKGRGQI